MTDKYTQKELIIKRLEEINDWVPAYQLRSVNTRFGFLGHQGDRRARELAQEVRIDRRIDGKYAYYRAKKINYETYIIRGLGEQVKIRI